MDENNNDLLISRIIKAPRLKVWKAWVQEEYFEQWWAPLPVKTKVISMVIEPGGSFDTEMTLPDGTVMPSRGCFLDVVPQQRIVFTDAMSAGWRPNKEPFMTVIIELKDHADGTEYTASVLHNNAEDRQKHEEMGFLIGWGTALEQLSKVAESL